ncbi:hypothetical protein HPB50_008967 [Hyalomma asiaticum]|uniref:Uncharacterized protein n=1 Tax=Hyalomma asiaticum TaxID=266040 RepID=A0ACB7RY38_HYAAI|nr:hypothetical protein HPB50_008967 [Hyalomma asiaticum]
MGNSVVKPSSSDLTFTNHTGNKTWTNEGEDLGSGHYIVETCLQATCKGTRIHRIVDWNQFRVNRKDLLYEGSYDDWREKLLSDVAAAAKEVEIDSNIEAMDSRLAHFMEAERSTKQRWEKNKLNRALRKRIARLNTKIAQHAGELERKQWTEVLTHCIVYSHELVWFPAHPGSAIDGVPDPDEMPHARARQLACRPGASGPSRPGPLHLYWCGTGDRDAADADPLTTFNEIKNHYKLGRRTLPTPHKELSIGQEIALHQIQTGTLPSPTSMASFMGISPQIDETAFYNCVTSSDRRSQLRAIQESCEVAGDLRL